jgi:predicted lipid carrier protein YhbT
VLTVVQGSPEVATVAACRNAVDRLAATLDELDPEVRARHVPDRTVVCRVKDLNVSFTARVDETGVHDVAQLTGGDRSGASADVRVALDSDDLVALAAGDEDFISAWLRGRVQVSAPMRDMLRLRSLLGL